MPNNLKTDPKGVDLKITALQKAVYKALDDKLIDGKVLHGYGRAYKNKRKERYVLEAYKGKNEYEDIAGLDNSCFFFFMEDNVSVTENPSANLNICFILNLDDFYDEQVKRMDEEIKGIVFNSIINNKSLNLSNITTGVDYLNGILNGWLSKTSVMHRDMHPHLVFTMRGNLSYSYKNCN